MASHLTEMIRLIIKLMSLPQRPDNVQPTIGQAAISMALGMTAQTGLAEVSGSPDRLAGGSLSKLLSRLAEVVVAGAAELNITGAIAGDGDRTSTRNGRQDGAMGIASAMVAKHHQEFGRQQVACAG